MPHGVGKAFEVFLLFFLLSMVLPGEYCKCRMSLGRPSKLLRFSFFSFSVLFFCLYQYDTHLFVKWLIGTTIAISRYGHYWLIETAYVCNRRREMEVNCLSIFCMGTSYKRYLIFRSCI